MLPNVLLARIQSEYLEMPGLQLTLQQVQRLCGVEGVSCKCALDALVDRKILRVTPDGRYVRLTTGQLPPPAKADLRSVSRSVKVAS